VEESVGVVPFMTKGPSYMCLPWRSAYFSCRDLKDVFQVVVVFGSGQLGDLACLGNAERWEVFLLADQWRQREDQAVQVGSEVPGVSADACVVGDKGFHGEARSFHVAIEVSVFEGVPEAFSVVHQDVVGRSVEVVPAEMKGRLVLVVPVFEGSDGDVVGIKGGFDEVHYVVD